MVLDTSSDIVWLQCAPCKRCYSQTDPVFDLRKSSSFSSLPCSSPLYRHLDSPDYSSKSKTCLYQVSYDDGSFTFGDFSTETLTFRSSKVPKVALSCGHDNEGLFVGAAGEACRRTCKAGEHQARLTKLFWHLKRARTTLVFSTNKPLHWPSHPDVGASFVISSTQECSRRHFGRAAIVPLRNFCSLWISQSGISWTMIVCLYNTDVETEDWTCDPFLKRFLSEYRINKNFSITAFIKFVVNRSKGCATEIRLPVCVSEEALKHVAASCPRLKTLTLPSDVVYYKSRMIPDMIGKWKDLEYLLMGSCYHDMEKIISQIGLNCKNFCYLDIRDCLVTKDAALAIAKLPNLKHIVMVNIKIERVNFVRLLKGCKNLISLDARNCLGFDAGDREISKLASHISDFKCHGSRVFDRHTKEGKYIWFHDFVYDGR
ncbi:hypothetical protein ACLB2K_011755 [Fragaria x ananassa]